MARGAQGRALFTQTNYLELFLFLKLMMHEAHYLWFQSKGPIKTAQSLHFITWALGNFWAITLTYLYHGNIWGEHLEVMRQSMKWNVSAFSHCLLSWEVKDNGINRVLRDKDLGSIFWNLTYTMYPKNDGDVEQGESREKTVYTLNCG